MLKLDRNLVNQVLTKAITTTNDSPLWAWIDLNSNQIQFADFCEPSDLDALKGKVIIYNQSSALEETLDHLRANAIDGQQLIEIFEDTKGVIGIRAYLKQNKMLIPEEMELL